MSDVKNMDKPTKFERDKMFEHHLTQIPDKSVKERIKNLAGKCLDEKWIVTDDLVFIISSCAFCDDTHNDEDYYRNCDECLLNNRLCNVKNTENTLVTQIIIKSNILSKDYIEDIIDFDEYKMFVKYLEDLKENGFLKWENVMELDEFLRKTCKNYSQKDYGV